MSASLSLLLPSTPLPPLRAEFCWYRSSPGQDYEVGLFRREFSIDSVDVPRRIAVTADNRYVLWLNGEIIGRGPLRGTLEAYQVECYDLRPRLRRGRNVLAAEVRWMGEDTPAAEIHSRWPGWWLQDIDGTELDTPGQWSAFADTSVRPNHAPPFSNVHTFLGRLDRVEPARRPSEWQGVLPSSTRTQHNPSLWNPAVANGPPARSPGWGLAPLRRLVSRELPALTEEPALFRTFLQDRQSRQLPWTVPPGQKGELWLDASAMTTSYPRLCFHGGRSREVHVIYAEALGRWQHGGTELKWEKLGPRADLAVDEPHGVQDELLLPGGSWTFESFHWRSFRFIKLVVMAGAEAVTLERATHTVTYFPHTYNAHFRCAEPAVASWWEISLRTLRLCAHETYEDCPYYEQLNYAADTQLQSLATHYLANDTRLTRRCLELFRDSLGSEGLVSARAPSHPRQIIPPFALNWIQMVNDYVWWCGEPAKDLLDSCLPAIDHVLSHFSRHITPAGVLGPLQPWSWVDWINEWPNGVPTATRDPSGCTVLSGLFVRTLDIAAKLHQTAGEPDAGSRWTRLAERIRHALRKNAWSEHDGLFVDGLSEMPPTFSQHAQVMAILCGATDDHQRRRIGRRLLNDKRLVAMSLSQRFWLARALEKLDCYDAFFSDVLAPWRTMLAHGLTTWPERADPCRSDCHGWSAWMVYDFFASVLGVTAVEPGWKHIQITPHISVTDYAAGAFDCPTGRISVEWSKTISARIVVLQLATPPGVPVTIRIAGSSLHLPTGANGRWTFPLPQDLASQALHQGTYVIPR